MSTYYREYIQNLQGLIKARAGYSFDYDAVVVYKRCGIAIMEKIEL